MSNIMITGIGLVGSQIARILINEYKLKPILYDIRFDYDYLETIFNLDSVVFVQGDILNTAFLQRTVEQNNVSIIIHLAAVLPMRVGHDAHPGFYAVNSWGTSNLLFTAVETGVKRLVMFSTNGVYQFRTNKADKPVPENFPSGLSEHNSYGNSKAVAEYLLRELVSDGKLDAKIIRPGEIYGPVINREGNDPIYWKAMLDAAIKGEPYVLKNHPEHRLDWVYAKDVAMVAILLAIKESTPNTEYHATGEKILGIYDWKNIIDEIFPKNNIDIENCGKGGWNYPLSMTKVKEDLEYVPQYSLKQGMLDYIEWFKRTM